MKRLMVFAAVTMLLLCTGAIAQEGQVILDSPDQVRAGTDDYRVQTIVLERGDLDQPAPRGAYIRVHLTGDGGLSRTIEWREPGEDVTTMLAALNTANLSTRSLQQRILDRAMADGKMPSGTVQ